MVCVMVAWEVFVFVVVVVVVFVGDVAAITGAQAVELTLWTPVCPVARATELTLQ